MKPDPDQLAFSFLVDIPWVPTRSPRNFPDIEPTQEESRKQVMTYSESMIVIIEKDVKPDVEELIGTEQASHVQNPQ